MVVRVVRVVRVVKVVRVVRVVSVVRTEWRSQQGSTEEEGAEVVAEQTLYQTRTATLSGHVIQKWAWLKSHLTQCVDQVTLQWAAQPGRVLKQLKRPQKRERDR